MFLNTTAIILSSFNSKDADKLYRVYSQDEGKLLCIAKGVRRAKSKRSPHLDTLNLVKLQLNKSGDFYYIQSASVLEDFKNIKSNIVVSGWALYLLESLSILVEEEDLYTFNRLLQSLQKLNSEPSKRVVYGFLKDLIQRQGYWNNEYENSHPYIKLVSSSERPSEIDQQKIDIFFSSLLEEITESRLNSVLLLKNL